MSLRPLLPGWTVPPITRESHIHRYSVVGDILNFKYCRRQYGFFCVRGFTTASSTFRYFGILVHDVLDRILRHYRVNPVLPDQERVRQLVVEAHHRLVRSGIRPFNSHRQQWLATKLIHRFVLLVGPSFFPHVTQTEYRLERTLRTPGDHDYVLSGVVDVLSGATTTGLRPFLNARAGEVEIWDYKSGGRPPEDSPQLQDYEYQLNVYAELYRQQTGQYPARSVLVFVGELADDTRWSRNSGDVRDFPSLLYTVRPQAVTVEPAMRDFHQTVEMIEAERAKPYAEQWLPPPTSVEVPPQICRACELRYGCAYYRECHPQSRRECAEPL